MNNVLKFVAINTLLLVHHQSFAASETELQSEILKQKEQLQLIEKQLAELKTTMIIAQEQGHEEKPASHHNDKNWQINSYGSVLYKSEEVYRNIQDSDPERKASTDLERVVLEFVYDFDAKWQVEIELEYEHGGVQVRHLNMMVLKSLVNLKQKLKPVAKLLLKNCKHNILPMKTSPLKWAISLCL